MQVSWVHFGNHDSLTMSQVISHGYFLELRIKIRNRKSAGLKCRAQVTGQVTGYRPQTTGQVTGQVTGHRSQVTGQVTGHKKTIGRWTKLFWTDVLLRKNKISQGTLMVFLSFKQY